jgi:hypothetical protein
MSPEPLASALRRETDGRRLAPDDLFGALTDGFIPPEVCEQPELIRQNGVVDLLTDHRWVQPARQGPCRHFDIPVTTECLPTLYGAPKGPDTWPAIEPVVTT